ncbi:4'-phosphopantetheinyl transferase superfamily protein [Streptomyces roseus]|uniref:4'-phosphopantetheinyl transferase family protein n=1 Tax=Streptomyces roseus TaxID=66430 RepID=UPI00340BA06A
MSAVTRRVPGLLVPGRLVLGTDPVRAEPAGPGSLWLVDARGQGEAALRLAPTVLDAGERQRAAAFRWERDRRCWVAARVGLRLLLGARQEVAPAAVRLEREPCAVCGGADGRPVAPGSGLWFSVSHSSDLALLAFGAAPLGVDVEALPEPELVSELAGWLHARETAELEAGPEAERPAAFARTWVRKEAYLKGLGVGLARDPALDYLGAGPVASAPSGWEVADVAVPAGFAGAVARTAVALTAAARTAVTGPAGIPSGSAHTTGVSSSSGSSSRAEVARR